MESIHDKTEIREAAETMRLIIENKDDLAKAIAEMIKRIGTGGEEVKQ